MTNVERAAIGGSQCVSCGAPLAGPYCSQCGEHAFDADALTLKHFLQHTVADEVLHFDGATLRSLRLLFTRPGALTLEFSAGRRRAYVNPFRLLVVSIIVYALATSSGFVVFWNIGGVTASMAPASVRRTNSVANTIDQIDHYGFLRQRFEATQDRLKSESAREKFHARLETFAEPASFANVLMLAAALHLCFWGKRRFLEDAAFSMHVISFVLLSSLTLVAAFYVRRSLGGFFFQLIMLVGAWQFIYLAFAIRRFYLPEGGWTRWPVSIVAALLLYILNTVFMTAVQVAGAAIALALA